MTNKRTTSCRQDTMPTPTSDPRQAYAALLDRLADQQLQAGHHGQAERLAHTAAALREAGR